MYLHYFQYKTGRSWALRKLEPFFFSTPNFSSAVAYVLLYSNAIALCDTLRAA